VQFLPAATQIFGEEKQPLLHQEIAARALIFLYCISVNGVAFIAPKRTPVPGLNGW
jgi:hypothetical protein